MLGRLGPLGSLGTGISRKKTVTAAQIIGAPAWVPEYNQDFIEFVSEFPDIDARSNLKARVLWSTTQTSAGAATFRLRHARAASNVDEFPALSAMATAIAKDTIIGTSADDVQKTEYGQINPGTIKPSHVVKFRLDILSASSLTIGSNGDNIKVYGVEFSYKPATIL